MNQKSFAEHFDLFGINTLPLIGVVLVLLSLRFAEFIVFADAGGTSVELERLPWLNAKTQKPEVVALVRMRESAGRIVWGMSGILQTFVLFGAICFYCRVLLEHLGK